MDVKNNGALVRNSSSAVEKAAPGAKRILSGMVADALMLVKSVKMPRIILVDDESSYLDLLEDVIRKNFSDAIVLKFVEGEPAWLELLKTPPDFLITDLERPGKMNGWEMIPLLAERKTEFPIMLVTGSTKGEEIHQKVISALNGKDEVLFGKIQSGEFKDEDLQDPVAWQTPSNAVQNLIQRVSLTLNITFLAKPFDTENFIRILETALKTYLRP
jgi:CheY-like chemotaxis protein